LNYYNSNDSIFIFPTGDPSFLHPAYEQQPVFKFLQNCRHIVFNSSGFDQHLGAGWSWMITPNLFFRRKAKCRYMENLHIALSDKGLKVIPSAIPINIKDSLLLSGKYGLLLQKPWDKNEITVYSGNPTQTNIEYRIPFVPGKKISSGISAIRFTKNDCRISILVKETQAIKVIHNLPMQYCNP
jgi:D-alanyl-D-alanine carboxypeptidase/D-alanyl-D-alanine-endopeptidase (penicillin-binding protein 4)